MDRRKFVEISLLAPFLIITRFSQKYPLTSTPDSGTKFDKEKSDKVIQLADHVINTVKDPKLWSYSEMPRSLIITNYEGSGAEIELEKAYYSVWVHNYNENSQESKQDAIQISIKPKDDSKIKKTVLKDTGLDGRCDYGLNKKENILFTAKSEENPNGIGLQHQKKFQDLYDVTIDKLLMFYEGKP